MRTKALLVDGTAGTQGPVVHLEHGVWEIDSHPYVQVVCLDRDVKVTHQSDMVKILGPTRISVNVNLKYQGPNLHSQARHVKDTVE